MLSGVKDEVVPREHMEGLWELVMQREGKHATGTTSASGTPRKRNVSTTNASANSSPAGAARFGDGSAGEASSKQAEIKFAAYDARSLSKFVEFEHGTHSE